MELRHLRYFVTVAEELNFTRAAAVLGTAQPSLSQQIRDLEHELGVQLLVRSKRKVELTEAGAVFLAEARSTLAQAERAVARARNAVLQEEEVLRIGFVPAAEVAVFPDVLPRLAGSFPHVRVRLHSLSTLVQEEALLSNEIDVAFMRPPVYSHELLSRTIATEPMLAVVPATHHLAKLERVPPSALDGEPFISGEQQQYGQVHDVVVEYFARHGLCHNVVQYASNVLLNLNLISIGLGISLLPAYVKKLAGPTLRCVPLEGDPPQVSLLKVSRKDNRSPALRQFLEMIRNPASR